VVPGLFSVAPKFSDLTARFKPEMKTSTLAQLQSDFNGLSAAQSQFTNQLVPALATQLSVPPADLSASLQQKFPATFAGLQALPAMGSQFNQTLTTLSKEIPDFNQADSIPTASISPSSIPWALLVVGVLLIACGVLVRRWWRVGVALVIGALLVATPLALSLPGKATAADSLQVQMSPLLTAKTVASADQSLATLQTMSTQLQTELLPALAQMLNLPSAQFNTFLASNFPAVGSALSNLPSSVAQFKALVTAMDQSLADQNAISSTQFTPIVRTILATGGFVLLVGLLGAADLAFRRRSGAVAS
jgi:hypothetical protein